MRELPFDRGLGQVLRDDSRFEGAIRLRIFERLEDGFGVKPWRKAFRREACFPFSLRGPVLFSALRRFASICLSDVMPAARSRPAPHVSALGAELQVSLGRQRRPQVPWG